MKSVMFILAIAALAMSGCNWQSDHAKRNGAEATFPSGDTPGKDTTGASSAGANALPSYSGAPAAADHGTTETHQ